MFWQNALANFLGALAAAAVLWGFVTRFYDLPRSRKEKRKIVAIAYGLIKRELQAASTYCEELKKVKPSQINAVPPITQAWETLHSTEAFKLFSAEITEKLVYCYSLIFRLSEDVELSQRLFLFKALCLPNTDAENVLASLMEQTQNYAKQAADGILKANQEFSTLLQNELGRLSPDERNLFEKACRTVGTGAPNT